MPFLTFQFLLLDQNHWKFLLGRLLLLQESTLATNMLISRLCGYKHYWAFHLWLSNIQIFLWLPPLYHSDLFNMQMPKNGHRLKFILLYSLQNLSTFSRFLYSLTWLHLLSCIRIEILTCPLRNHFCLKTCPTNFLLLLLGLKQKQIVLWRYNRSLKYLQKFFYFISDYLI